MRIGFGYDLHPLVEGRSLILGGIQIPFEKGLDGHSDADVLCHSIPILSIKTHRVSDCSVV